MYNYPYQRKKILHWKKRGKNKPLFFQNVRRLVEYMEGII